MTSDNCYTERHYVIYDDSGNRLTVKPDDDGTGDVEIVASWGEVKLSPVFIPQLVKALIAVAKDLVQEEVDAILETTDDE